MPKDNNSTIIETYLVKGEVAVIPVKSPPPNDMRPRQVDRAKVKAGRKQARRNRRRRG